MDKTIKHRVRMAACWHAVTDMAFGFEPMRSSGTTPMQPAVTNPPMIKPGCKLAISVCAADPGGSRGAGLPGGRHVLPEDQPAARDFVARWSVYLLGLAGCGKTAIWKLLLRAQQAFGEKRSFSSLQT